MHSGTEVSAALLMAFMLLYGAAGLIVVGLIVYFLVTLSRIAGALEQVVALLKADRDLAATPPLLLSSEEVSLRSGRAATGDPQTDRLSPTATPGPPPGDATNPSGGSTESDSAAEGGLHV